MARISFKESQKLKPKWIWLVFMSLYVLMFWALNKQLLVEIDVAALSSIIFSISLIVIFNIIVIVMKLDVEIDETKITYRYKPFHLKPRIIYWEEVSDFYTRDYRPIMEYGGHGLKRRMKFGRSFTVSGKKGLQLILKDSKRILFGTQKPIELERIIGKLKKQN